MKAKLNDVIEVLNHIYDCGNIPQNDIEEFAEDVLKVILDEESCLNDVFIMAYEFESKMKENGFEFESSNDWWLFNNVLDLLERNPRNAKRLVVSFLDFHDPMTFEVIMQRFAEWITPQERLKILDIAIGTFDQIVWRDYV